MRRLTVTVLIIGCITALPNMGDTAQKPAYVPGEVLVKYKPSVQIAASAYYKAVRDISTVGRFKKIGVHHVKLPKNMTVEEALNIYSNDPDVEYAEPNYYRYLSAIPNDTHFDKLWGLHNTGQSVNGTGGTTDADIDAPEAWDVATGSSNVVVAVIDSGVDYNHPDLSANIWTNSGELAGNSIDDDGNGYVDDVRGWDFFDSDNDPVDSNGHGTHVAGIIAAVGNNSLGVAGVSWAAKIMPLRVGGALGTISDIISAIQYATEKGAHVINLSLGGGGYSQAEKDAIDASSAVVVCAAGNGGDDNDSTPHYPSNYPSPNIIAVAATDQDDDLASFSNFGVNSVDVAAPGVNIYSTMPARQTVWSDNFDDNDISDWTKGGTNNTWGTTNTFSSSGSYSLADSPVGNYLDNTDSWAITPVINLSSHSGAKLDFKLRGISEACCDYLDVEVSTDIINWTTQPISVEGYFFPIFSGTTHGLWFNATVDLGAYGGNGTVYVKLGFISDGLTTFDGFYIDDIAVTAASSSYVGTVYDYNNGTSMAAPFVSGLAALIKGFYPSLTNIQIKSQIESTVDSKASLSNKIGTGGRVNASNALLLPAVPGSLNAATASTSQVELTWADNSPNESGFEIERKTGSGGTYSRIATVASNTISYSDIGLNAFVTYYYRVRAYNSNGNSNYSNEAGATTLKFSLGGGGGCFIATAAYGARMAEETEILQEFRDKVLLANSAGKAFVSLYDKISPPIADSIGRHERLRMIVRMALLPVVGMSWVSLRVGFVPALLILVLFVSIPLIAFKIKRKIIPLQTPSG